MKYSETNARTMAIVMATCVLVAIFFGVLIRHQLGSGGAAIEKSKIDDKSTADVYQFQ